MTAPGWVLCDHIHCSKGRRAVTARHLGTRDSSRIQKGSRSSCHESESRQNMLWCWLLATDINSVLTDTYYYYIYHARPPSISIPVPKTSEDRYTAVLPFVFRTPLTSTSSAAISLAQMITSPHRGRHHASSTPARLYISLPQHQTTTS